VHINYQTRYLFCSSKGIVIQENDRFSLILQPIVKAIVEVDYSCCIMGFLH